MIYIQTADGLSPISSQLTKEKIITALGYTPADGATFWEDESGALIVADAQGHIIARIDNNGLESTTITAKSIQLNGEDLNQKLQELANNQTPNIDLSPYQTHIENADKHVSTQDRENWNNKSNFSGDYTDLINAPHIVNDNEDEVIITDSQGNMILHASAAGLNTTNIYSNGEAVLTQSSLNTGYGLNGKKILILGDSINAGSSWQKGFSTLLAEDFPQAIVQNNARSGQTLANTQLEAELTAAQQNNFIPDYILINGGINDLTRSIDVGTVVENNYTTSSFDTATMVGGFEHLIMQAQSIMPSAKIVFFNTQKTIDIDLTTQANAWIEIAKACKKHGIKYVDIYNEGNYSPYSDGQVDTFTTDGIHLTEAGYRRFWPMIKHAIMNA